MIEMSGISKAFSGNVVLNNVSFELKPGEIHALMGENGAGKSTMMKILTGIHKRDEGVIKVDGKEVHCSSPQEAENLGIAVIHQELNILPDLTVTENLFLGKEKTYGIFGILKKKEMHEEAKALLAKLGLNIDPKNHIHVRKRNDHKPDIRYAHGHLRFRSLRQDGQHPRRRKRKGKREGEGEGKRSAGR